MSGSEYIYEPIQVTLKNIVIEILVNACRGLGLERGVPVLHKKAHKEWSSIFHIGLA